MLAVHRVPTSLLCGFSALSVDRQVSTDVTMGIGGLGHCQPQVCIVCNGCPLQQVDTKHQDAYRSERCQPCSGAQTFVNKLSYDGFVSKLSCWLIGLTDKHNGSSDEFVSIG